MQSCDVLRRSRIVWLLGGESQQMCVSVSQIVHKPMRQRNCRPREDNDMMFGRLLRQLHTSKHTKTQPYPLLKSYICHVSFFHVRSGRGPAMGVKCFTVQIQVNLGVGRCI